MDLRDYGRDALKERLRRIIAIAAMGLTDDEVAILAYELGGTSPAEIIGAFRAIAGDTSSRPFVRLRNLFKDAPFDTYAGVFTMMLVRDWRKNAGAFSKEELSSIGKVLGIDSEPTSWADISDHSSSVEDFSGWVKKKFHMAVQAVQPYAVPIGTMAGGAMGGVVGAAIGGGIGYVLSDGSSPPPMVLPAGRLPALPQKGPLAQDPPKPTLWARAPRVCRRRGLDHRGFMKGQLDHGNRNH